MDSIIPQKRCFICTLTKPLTDFYKNKARPDGRTTDCKECSKLRNAGRKRSGNTTKAMRAVGFSCKDYENTSAQQDGKCAICGKPETYKNQWGVKKLAVDHDHATGEFRGLLCQSCNTKLAVLEDEEFVKAATIYLQQKGR